jgi:hypothetical protein
MEVVLRGQLLIFSLGRILLARCLWFACFSQLFHVQILLESALFIKAHDQGQVKQDRRDVTRPTKWFLV